MILAHRCFEEGCDCIDYRIQQWLSAERAPERASYSEAAAFLDGMMAMSRHPEWGLAAVEEFLYRSTGGDPEERQHWMDSWDRLVSAVPLALAVSNDQ